MHKAMITAAVAAVALTVACQTSKPAPPAAQKAPTPQAAKAAPAKAAPKAAPKPSKGFNASPLERKLTTSELAVRNLNSAIKARQRAYEAAPESITISQTLVDMLLTRSQFMGTFKDLDQALEVSQKLLKAHPKDTRALELRAQTYQAVHRFADALADLKAANAIDGKERHHAITNVWLAQGDKLQQVLDIRQRAFDKGPTFQNTTALAAALAAVGRYKDADKHWVAALTDHYRDVSPFAVAYVAFQRGVMWAEQAGDADKGIALYTEAVRILPGYVVANVHLAELESEANKLPQAKERLAALIDKTQDPEPGGLLSELLAKTDPERAKTLAERSKSIYEDLFKRHPYAFLDHGSEFFMGPGEDPKRALKLAQTNLTIRHNSRALEIGLDAAEAASNKEALCAIAAMAPKTHPTTGLKESLKKVEGQCKANP